MAGKGKWTLQSEQWLDGRASMEWALGHSPRPPAGGGGGRSTLYIQDYNRQKQITLSGGVEGVGRGGGGKGGGDGGDW